MADEKDKMPMSGETRLSEDDDPPLTDQELLAGLGAMIYEANRAGEEELARMIHFVALAFKEGALDRIAKLLYKLTKASQEAQEAGTGI